MHAPTRNALRPVMPVFACSLAISAGLAALMVLERAGVPNPFELRIIRYLSLYQDLYAFAPYMAILLLALVPAIRNVGIALADWCGAHPRLLAALAALGLAAGSLFVCRAYPLTMDEYAVVFQSKIFAAGHLTGRFPPELLDWLIPKAIQGKFLKPDSHTGAVAAAYWPGFSLLLTPFTLLDSPWLLNPLIGGATVLLMHRLGLELFGERRSAGLVALLTLASSAVAINAMTYYTMPAHLLASALYVLLLLRPNPAKAFAAGVVGSYALVLHSPVPHLLFALPFIAWLAFQPRGPRLVAVLVIGYLPLCLLLGFGWASLLDTLELVTPSGALVAPSSLAESILSRLRSIQDWGRYETPSLVQHTLVFAKLWLWAVPALVAAAALGAWRVRRESGILRVLAIAALLTYLGYQCLPIYQGHGWGYRYFHQAWLALPLLAVAGLRVAPQAALGGYLAGSALLSLALLTPFQALQVRTFVDRHLAQLPPIPAQVRVVLINPLAGYYSWDLAQNDPFLRGRVTLLISQGPRADQETMAKVFPGYEPISGDGRAAFWGTR
jgi:hypothetical protein